MWAVVTSPGLTTESARRLMSSREARWAANPAASISTEARSCINSRTCSAPLPRSWARDVPIFDRGDVATRVPCGPRPDTRTPWVLSSCRASRMAGLPTPNCSARARSEGIRSPGLTVPVEPISLMREATLPGKVASRIREMVSTGTVKPGERIPSERALAEQLGVGRPAIREALQELKTQGVLVSGRGPQGTRVATSPLSKIGTSLAQLLGSGAEHVRELMQLRASVEIEAAGLAAHRASLEDIRRLADSVVKPGEVTTAHIDVSFHLAIARATHNALFSQIAQEIINLLHEHTQAVLDALYNQPGGVMAIQRQHEAVVQAIRLGNEDRAREEMRTHMQYVTKGLAELTGYGESIRLIIADLDGTLLESPKVITERTKKTVAAVRKVGAEVVLASARPPRSLRYYHQELRLTTPVIGYNGAVLWDLLAGIPIAQIPLAPKLAQEMVQLGRELGADVNIEATDEWFT